ncbi:MAG: FAD:protein FMN transferase [Rubrivivax sp.]|nr:FAD:protein FMN transferase [Rubrivivax sp.]
MFQSLQSLRTALRRHLPHRGPPPGLHRIEPVEDAGWYRDEAAIMGTAITAELWADSQEQGAEALAAVMGEMRRIDEAMSPHKSGSELSRINREAFHRWVPVSGEMFGLLDRALQFSALTEGAFDISFAAVGRLYDYRAGTAPDEAALAAALPGVGWRHLELDALMHAVRFHHPATCIDLGGFAKGHAVDRAATELKRLGIGHAFVSAGGDSRVIGDRRGRPWQLGVRDPRREGQLVAVLPLEEVSVSTSGDYERCFERDGERVHHLLDPATGRPAQGARSVTVLAPDGLTAEALSKTAFVRGPQAGLALIERVPGVDAVIVDAQGVLHRSSGLLLDTASEQLP